jgi:hypothetical protein
MLNTWISLPANVLKFRAKSTFDKKCNYYIVKNKKDNKFDILRQMEFCGMMFFITAKTHDAKEE